MAFLMEADRLKSVERASRITGSLRRENSAEHSWHAALFALTLADQAPEGCDINKVIAMLLLHDLVEIDAGDAPVFAAQDASAKAALEAREAAAAERIFGLLPADQAAHFLAIWHEFEANDSAEARFAKSLDRFVPPNLNMATGGGSWVEYDVSYDTFEARVGTKVNHGAPGLWAWLAPKVRDFMRGLRA
ncbi:MAG: HD domain-containing protein [Pelagimonas sp.]|nr:HD domain-containing protein [Pelagimonas sp.]